jgi:hypothetical protein
MSLKYRIIKMSLSGESDASNRLFNYRRLTDHFNLQHAQRERNLNKLRAHSRQLIEFSRSIGLKIKQIFLTKRNVNDFDDSIKFFVKENDMSQEEIEFKCLMVKEISCLSRRKYQVLKRTLDSVFPIKMPGHEKLFSLRNKLDNFFTYFDNQKGFYVHPLQKIQYVCQKLIENNRDISFQDGIKIKLSFDGKNVSDTKIQLLNSTFNVINDELNATNVTHTFTLGN